ncbi:MAG: hypothetical protein AAFX50_10950, partial [Acidobacteriota bacterium]
GVRIIRVRAQEAFLVVREAVAVGIDHPDTDGDGLADGVEVTNGLDPLDMNDAALDPDADGLTNAEEIALGTDLNVADTDGDGLDDGDEVNLHATDPLVADSDGDALSDGLEVLIYGTDPTDIADAPAPIRVGDEFAGQSDQGVPAVDAQGRIHVVWSDRRTGNWEIFYALYGADGSVLIAATPLTDDPDDSRRPHLAVDSLGQVHVVWHDRRAGGVEVYYRRIDPGLDDLDGSAADPLLITVQGDTLISTPADTNSSIPRIAVDGLDRSHVVWADQNNGDVRYLRLGPAGAVEIAERGIVVGGTFRWRLQPTLGLDSNNHVHVSLSEQLGSLDAEVYYTMVDGGTGGTLIAPTVVSVDDGIRSRFPQLAVRSDDRVVVVFHDEASVDTGADVKQVVFDPYLDDRDGSASSAATLGLVGPDVISEIDAVESTIPSLAVGPQDSLRVSYFQDWTGNSGGLSYRAFDGAGTALIPEVSLTPNAGSSGQWSPGYAVANGVSTYVTFTEGGGISIEEGGGGSQEVRLWRVQPDDDGDGLGNGDERLLGTDPNNPDTDGGGRTDGEEVLVDGTNPLDPADDL